MITHDGITKVDPLPGRAEIRAVRPSGDEALTQRPRFKAIVKHIRARSNSVFFVVKGSKVDPSEGKVGEDRPPLVQRHAQVAASADRGTACPHRLYMGPRRIQGAGRAVQG